MDDFNKAKLKLILLMLLASCFIVMILYGLVMCATLI